MTGYMQAAVGGATQEYDLTLDRGADSALVHVRNVPILMAGRVAGVYAIAIRITQRARAIELLRENEADLRALVERQHGLLELIREILSERQCCRFRIMCCCCRWLGSSMPNGVSD